MQAKTSYFLAFRLEGEIISSVYGDYVDDNAAMKQARDYLRASAADMCCIHLYDDNFTFITKIDKGEAA